MLVKVPRQSRSSPFYLGIVGHAADKFTPTTERSAKDVIYDLIAQYQPQAIVSGGCHLGGVDIWAEEIAISLQIPTIIYRPQSLSWSTGYRPRNLSIASTSALVACVVVSEYPPQYVGQRFSVCYHCRRVNPPHVKSGGCWTAWKARRRVWRIVT